MNIPVSECAICGRQRNDGNRWFLLTESRWQDKVTILQWHDQVGAQAGVQSVCSAAHVQELVVHWMTTGGLDYPFARTREVPQNKGNGTLLYARDFVDTKGAQPIGELAIHRESIQRILRESPHSLTAILDALLGALQRDEPSAEAPIEMETEELCEVGSEVH
jgi:hypothetical protein